MIDATYLKAYRTASSLRIRKDTWLPGWAHKGGMNTKLPAIADANGCALSFFMSAGQVSDYTGAAALLDDVPEAQWSLGIAATTPTYPRPPSRQGHPAPHPRPQIAQ